MQCSHGRDVSFGSECWECEQDKRRHLEDDNRRQQAEEERLELRTGLPEFSEAYCRLWQQLAELHETLRGRESGLLAERSRLLTERDKLRTGVQSDWERIHEDLAKDLESQLEQGTPTLQDPPAALSDPAGQQRLADLFERLHSLGRGLGAPSAPVLPSDGPLVRIYRQLRVAAERLHGLTRSLPKTPKATIGCAVLLLPFAIVGAVIAVQEPKAAGGFLIYALALGIVVYFIARRFHLRTRLADACTATQECLASFLPIFERWPDLEFKPFAAWLLPSAALDSRIANAETNARVAWHNTILVLLDAYKSDNFRSHSLAPQLAIRNAEVARADRRLGEIAVDLELSPAKGQSIQHYLGLRSEIRRVGKLILDGRRLPGVTLELLRCETCGGPLSSAAKTCPHCSSVIRNRIVPD